NQPAKRTMAVSILHPERFRLWPRFCHPDWGELRTSPPVQGAGRGRHVPCRELARTARLEFGPFSVSSSIPTGFGGAWTGKGSGRGTPDSVSIFGAGAYDDAPDVPLGPGGSGSRKRRCDPGAGFAVV